MVADHDCSDLKFKSAERDAQMILNDEQKMVQEMMRNYSQNKLKPTAAERDKTAKFPHQELKVWRF